MACACEHEHASLVTGHAYSLLGTVRLTGGPQLVKLRNPWGREKYAGPMRDDDPAWTAAWKAEAGLVAADDGIFHIPLEDFKIAFTRYSILMYQDWNTAKKVTTGAGKQWDFTLTSSVNQEAIIAFDYLNTRHVPKGCPMKEAKVFYNMYIDGPTPIVIGSQNSYGAH